jgi:hypothetical protein
MIPRALIAFACALLACGRTGLDGPRDRDADAAETSDAHVFDAPNEPSAPPCTTGRVVLASQQAPGGLALDGTYIYWINGPDMVYDNGSVMRVDVCGEHPSELVATTQNAAWFIAASGTSVFWTERDGEVAESIDGGARSVYAPNQEAPYAIVIANGRVYWSSLGNAIEGSIQSCPMTGCDGSPTVYTATQGGSGIAVDDTNVYWTQPGPTGRVLMCPITGCAAPVVLTPALGDPGSITVSGGMLYWMDTIERTILSCVIADCASTVMTLTTTTHVLDNSRLTTDGVSLYWTNVDEGTVTKMSTTGGATTLLATNLWAPGDVVVDATSVYWSGSGSIVKLTPK